MQEMRDSDAETAVAYALSRIISYKKFGCTRMIPFDKKQNGSASMAMREAILSQRRRIKRRGTGPAFPAEGAMMENAHLFDLAERTEACTAATTSGSTK